MFVSIKKYLSKDTDGTTPLLEALLRISHLLLQGIAAHAVEGEQTDYERFQTDIRALDDRLDREPDPAELMVVAGTAVKALEEYNRHTSRLFKQHRAQYHTIVAMFSQTVASLSTGSETSLTHLHDIERQLERASMIEDIQALKGRLGECLDGVRDEALRQREESVKTITEIQQCVEKSKAEIAEASSLDVVTGLQGREAACRVIREKIRDGAHCYAALFIVDRMDLINARFGSTAGDQMIQAFADHLSEKVSATDARFRWNHSGLLVLLERPILIHAIRIEIQRLLAKRLEKNLVIGARSVLLPISATWTVVPLFETTTLEEVVQKLDSV